MKNIHLRKYYYHVRHRYFTMNNVVIMVALVIGASWAWGSIGMMQRNYDLQKAIDTKQREQTLAELQVATLKYEQNYYGSSEYKELSVHDHLGLANPGEKVLILPPNSAAAKNAEIELTGKKAEAPERTPSNLQQWTNFLFGGSQRGLRN